MLHDFHFSDDSLGGVIVSVSWRDLGGQETFFHVII